MPRYFKVTETRTTTLAHVIEAGSAKAAQDNFDSHVGLRDVVEDDSEAEYETVEVIRCNPCGGSGAIGTDEIVSVCDSCRGEGWVEK